MAVIPAARSASYSFFSLTGSVATPTFLFDTFLLYRWIFFMQNACFPLILIANIFQDGSYILPCEYKSLSLYATITGHAVCT